MDSKLKITVKPSAISTRPNLLPCSLYNRTELWHKREPTGFLYQGEWKLIHCQGKKKSDVLQCLRNRRVILFGDSTTRQWFRDIVMRYNCTQVTETWPVRKWIRPSTCVNNDVNLTVDMMSHALPLFGIYDNARLMSWSVPRRIDELIGDNEDVIVILHLYMHVNVFRYDVFQIKIRRIRQSVDRLFARNRLAKVLIKAPHTFKAHPYGPFRISDYFGYLYRYILFQEFSGLHDRIFYLDNKDLTTALQVSPEHPPDNVVSAMVDQMFSYVC